MDKVGWDLGAEPNGRLIEGKVCRQAWREITGQEPTRGFPGE
jgi:hypothetical protein